MIATRSHSVSASSMWCVVSTTVRPDAAVCRSRSHRFRRACGSSAPVGSSRKTSSGSCTSAQAIDSRCAWPPDSFSVRVAGRLGQADHAEHRVGAPGRHPVERGERPDLLAGGQPLEEGRRLELDADPGQQRRVARPGRQAEHADLAAVGLRRPSTISSVVVLPAPFGPRIPKNSPVLDLEADPVTAARSP